MCSFNMEIIFVLSATIIKKVVKCSLLVTPTTVWCVTFIRIEDYGLKESNDHAQGRGSTKARMKKEKRLFPRRLEQIVLRVFMV